MKFCKRCFVCGTAVGRIFGLIEKDVICHTDGKNKIGTTQPKHVGGGLTLQPK